MVFNPHFYFRYVLLKEKNMLLTMEEESKKEFKLFPNPERIDKVSDNLSFIKGHNITIHLVS